MSERERIARIVDPEAWNPEVQVWARDVRQAEALAKADAILARPEPSEAVVEAVARKLAGMRVYEGYNAETRARLIAGAMPGAIRDARAAIAAYEVERVK